MTFKSKVNFDWLGTWWQSSQICVFLQKVAVWQQNSYVLNVGLAGILCVLLIAALPYLSNNQSGLITGTIAIFWIFLWLGDRINAESTEIWTPIHLPVMVYWLIAVCATIASPVRAAAIDGLTKLTLYFILFVVMNRVLRSGKVSKFNWRSLIVGTYLLTSLIVCIYGIRQWYFGAAELATWTDPTSELAGTTRVYSYLGNPNLLGGYLLPTLPLSVVAIALWRSWGAKVFAATVAIAAIFCIRETYSRGAMYGLYAEILVLVILLGYWWSHKQNLPKWVIPGFIGGIVSSLALSILLFPTQRSRFLSAFLGRGDSSGNYRLNVWDAVFKMIEKRPILGIGTGNKAFNQIYPIFQKSGFSALGTYCVPLEIAVETGIVGLICYIWLVTTVVRSGWQQLNYSRSGQELDRSESLWIVAALSAISGMIIHGLVDTVWYRPQVQILWWLAIALIASFSVIPKNATEALKP